MSNKRGLFNPSREHWEIGEGQNCLFPQLGEGASRSRLSEPVDSKRNTSNRTILNVVFEPLDTRDVVIFTTHAYALVENFKDRTHV